MGSHSRPEQLLIALEPEAAAIYCRRLRRHQLLPERPPELRPARHAHSRESLVSPDASPVPALPELDRGTSVALLTSSSCPFIGIKITCLSLCYHYSHEQLDLF